MSASILSSAMARPRQKIKPHATQCDTRIDKRAPQSASISQFRVGVCCSRGWEIRQFTCGVFKGTQSEVAWLQEQHDKKNSQHGNQDEHQGAAGNHQTSKRFPSA